MATPSITKERLKQYDDLIAYFSDIERKGKTTPYTSTNTYMFSFLSKDGTLALRLSQEQITEFNKKHNTVNVIQHGRILKDFVAVPEELFSDLESLKTYVELSFEHTNGLIPKKR